jgi:hypothetical protein
MNLFHNLLSQPGFVNQPYSSYTPTFTGFSTPPVVQSRYFVINGMCHLWLTTLTHGVSNSTAANGVTFTLPFTSANTVAQNAPVDVIFSNGRQSAKGLCVIPANSNIATVYVDFSTSALWTASPNNKSFNLTLGYEVTGTTNYSAWTPTFGGFSVSPTVTARSIQLGGGLCHVYMSTSSHGTSNNSGASSTTFTLPYVSASGVAQGVQGAGGTATSRESTPFTISIAAGSNVATVYRNGTLATTWNGSGNKSFNISFFYETTGSSYKTWTPTFGGFSTDPVVTARYHGIGKMVHCTISTTSHGTSNSTAINGFWYTLPFSSNAVFIQNTAGNRIVDNSANQSVLSATTITPETDVGIMWKDATANTAWTGSGNKSFSTSFIYEAENLIPFETNDDPGVARPAIIAWGQSNLGTGVTTVASDLEIGYKQTYNKIRFYQYNTPYNFAAATHYLQTVKFLPMDYTNNKSYQTPDQNGTYSLQFYLYPQIQALLDRNLYVVHHGEGNTGLAVEWKPTTTIGDNHRELLFKIKATINKITDADGIAPDFKFLLIVHGEYDSRVLAYANAYEANLTASINGVRAISGLTNLPVIIVRLNTEMITAPVNPGTYGATIQAAQDAVAVALSDVYVYNPDGAVMHTDKIHYTVAGEHTIADGIYNLAVTNGLI